MTIDLPGIPGASDSGVDGGVSTPRNEVFAASSGPPPGLSIPTSLVPLPSFGKIYPRESPLHGLEQVEIKHMTTREEDLLMSPSLIQKGTVISELVRSCLLVRGVKIEDLLSGDRNALMVAIRISGYGEEYITPMKCQKCEFLVEQYVVNLADLIIRPLEIDPVRAGENRFQFNLPASKKVVEFRFLTVGEEEEILRDMEAKKKKGLLNQQAITTRLIHNLLSVDGVEDRNQVVRFVQNMPARDSLALRQYIDRNEPTIEMKTKFVCPSCEHEAEVAVPFGVGFFWPNVSGDGS